MHVGNLLTSKNLLHFAPILSLAIFFAHPLVDAKPALLKVSFSLFVGIRSGGLVVQGAGGYNENNVLPDHLEL